MVSSPPPSPDRPFNSIIAQRRPWDAQGPNEALAIQKYINE